MANYIPTWRSNTFKVKDLEKFMAWCNEWPGMEIVEDNEMKGKGDSAKPTGEKLVTLLQAEDSESGIPSYFYNQETGEEVDRDFLVELATHLVSGWVAVLMEIGYEKLRYLTGVAVAVNNKGEIERVSLSDIYEVAKKLGKHVTVAEY